MNDHTEIRPYDALVEKLGRYIGVFGLFLGCSFIYGYFYQLFFSMQLDAVWLVSVYSTEALIRIGIPWVLSLAAIALILFCMFPKAESFNFGVLFIAVVGAIIALSLASLFQYFRVSISSSPVYSIIEFTFYGFCAVSFIPWGLKKYSEKYSRTSVAVDLIVGIGFSCVFVPFMTSASDARDIGYLYDKIPLVSSEGKTVGVLLGITDSKFVVLSCSDMKTIKIYEPSDQYSVAKKPISEDCQRTK
ncbi:hypothetical protein [Pseudomonas viridiflava]|uniref:hypothetical protein n=1 Tax=Pseudomonas viridiflava TaxID=33069 RepID=UPI0013D0C8F7|nr:hypothetical protein [Pseudomonas viridiflava]